MRGIHAIWAGHTVAPAIPLVRWIAATVSRIAVVSLGQPVGLGFAMLTSHLSLATITSQDWDRWWPLAAIVATAFALVGYMGYRYAFVWQQWRQTSAALVAEQRRLNATLEMLFDPYVIAEPVRDAGGRVVDFIYAEANPAACAWIGVDRHHLLGRRMLEVYPSVETTGLLKIFIDTAEYGLPATVEAFPFPHDKEGKRWLDIRAVRVENQVGLAWRDVTERHEADAKRVASEEQFRLLAENSSDVVIRIGRDGTVLWVSPSVTSVLGWSQTDCIGRLADDLFATSEGREQFQRELQKALMGQAVMLRSQLAAKGGDVHWVEIHAGPFRTEDGQIDSIVASFRGIDAEVRAEAILERRASTDELTNLLNRKEALERVEILNKRGGQQLAALWCDIDRFKIVNDTYGHAAGDAVLKALADRIRGCLRSTDDMGARIGGDELLVLLHGVRDLKDAMDIAEKLRRAAAEPIPTPAGPITITLSIGVTIARPDERTDALMARADDAMYQAKNRGRNQVVALEEPVAAVERQAGGV
jgi:diguanylate cyclase (GGDEF)-like protein/PAS domain S-box-containing protein